MYKLFNRISIPALFFLLACPAAAETVFIQGSSPNSECVVLLHGLARSSRSMKPLQQELQKQGYAVLNIDYPSTRYVIEELVDLYVKPQVQKHCGKENIATHFVTHSMGGILVRYYLSKTKPSQLGRVVMISPPNQGSELVDVLGQYSLFKWVNGPAGEQLGTSVESLPNQLGPIDFDLAVVTGNRSFNPIYSYLIPGDDDGKVSVKRAQLAGMQAFQIVPATHTFIARNKTVIALVVNYLKRGCFEGELSR